MAAGITDPHFVIPDAQSGSVHPVGLFIAPVVNRTIRHRRGQGRGISGADKKRVFRFQRIRIGVKLKGVNKVFVSFLIIVKGGENIVGIIKGPVTDIDFAKKFAADFVEKGDTPGGVFQGKPDRFLGVLAYSADADKRKPSFRGCGKQKGSRIRHCSFNGRGRIGDRRALTTRQQQEGK